MNDDKKNVDDVSATRGDIPPWLDIDIYQEIDLAQRYPWSEDNCDEIHTMNDKIFSLSRYCAFICIAGLSLFMILWPPAQ